MKSTLGRLMSTATMTSLIFTGCKYSPILSHTNARVDSAETTQADTDPNEAKVECAFQFKKLGYCASMTWDKLATDEAEGEFTLRFWDPKLGTESGPYVSPEQKVHVKLWMASMGHGSSPVTVEAAKDSGGQIIPGIFQAKKVYFVMAGAWEIWVQLKAGSQVTDQAKVDIEI